jgi:hypothetical protein
MMRYYTYYEGNLERPKNKKKFHESEGEGESLMICIEELK